MASANVDIRVGQRIQQARLLHSAMTVGDAAAFIGVSEEDYLAMEAGQLRPSEEQIMLLADLMSVLPSWFFEESAEP